ncbi:MAG: hypothetical protein WC655_29500, partial [Candidatus Hydrogenedentales bacterium]
MRIARHHITRIARWVVSLRNPRKALRYINWPRVFVGYPAYRERMVRSLIAAAAIHLVVALVMLAMPRTPRVLASVPGGLPFMVDLRPASEPTQAPQPPAPPEPPPMQLIDTVAPADAPVDPKTDLIAVEDSKARDMSNEQGEGIAPQVNTVGELDELRIAEQAPKPEAPPPQAASPPVETAQSPAPAPEASDAPAPPAQPLP